MTSTMSSIFVSLLQINFPMQQKIIFATNNPHKLKEIQSLLGDHFLLLSLKDIGFSGDIPETQPTLEGNASQKAHFIFQRFNQPCFADDTGLEVEVLHNEPGVFSARYAGSLEVFGTEEKRTEANMQKLLHLLEGQSNRKARFRTVIAYRDGTAEFLFEGMVEGTIATHKKGTAGFGYDPLFIPEGYATSFAEMPLSEKNLVSHRARAFSNFVAHMQAKK